LFAKLHKVVNDKENYLHNSLDWILTKTVLKSKITIIQIVVRIILKYKINCFLTDTVIPKLGQCQYFKDNKIQPNLLFYRIDRRSLKHLTHLKAIILIIPSQYYKH